MNNESLNNMTHEEPIHLQDSDPNWPTKFEKETQLIEKTLGPWIVGGIHHVGSTAVPGLRAKPIIDIQVGVNDLNHAKACIPLPENIGYVYVPYKTEIDRVHTTLAYANCYGD